MAVRRRGRVVGRSDRVPTWFGMQLGVPVNVAANTSVLIGTLNAVALLARPFTIIRSRLLAVWDSDQQIATETPIGVVGGIVVSDSAVAAGIVSVPTPNTEFNADWYFYQQLYQAFTFSDATGIETSAGRQYMIDSKAMRKIGTDDDLAIVCQEFNGFGATISLFGRFLVKLH